MKEKESDVCVFVKWPLHMGYIYFYVYRTNERIKATIGLVWFDFFV